MSIQITTHDTSRSTVGTIDTVEELAIVASQLGKTVVGTYNEHGEWTPYIFVPLRVANMPILEGVTEIKVGTYVHFTVRTVDPEEEAARGRREEAAEKL